MCLSIAGFRQDGPRLQHQRRKEARPGPEERAREYEDKGKEAGKVQASSAEDRGPPAGPQGTRRDSAGDDPVGVGDPVNALRRQGKQEPGEQAKGTS